MPDASGYRAPAATDDAPAGQIISLDILGMTCAGCAKRVETALAGTEGVETAPVNLALERADVIVAPGVDPERLVQAVRDVGFDAVPRGGDRREDEAAEAAREARAAADHRRELIHLAAAIALTLPLLAEMIPMMMGGAHWLPGWAQFALAAPVQFWIGARFYKGAFAALRRGGANMDVLVALGTSAAFFYSVAVLVGLAPSGHLYFEAAAVVITLILVGKTLESRAKRGTTAAVRELMTAQPRTALRQRDGRVDEVAIEEIATGDTVIVRAGQTVPVDGRIVEGASDLDESLVTGESVPVARKVGDRVVAGSINGGGGLTVTVERVGADSTLARIARLVAAAQSGKAPIQRLVDRIAAIFVPAVVTLAVVSFLGWMLAGAGFETALITAVSVLVIACPCALGLATPTAIVAGTGAAAKAGILVKDIATLEQAARIDMVVFDKTGTLTEGKPDVVQIAALDAAGQRASDDREEGHATDRVLSLAAAAQAASDHPLAGAIRRAAEHRGLEIVRASDAEAIPGEGVVAKIDGRRIALGNAALMARHGIADAAVEAGLAAVENPAATVMLLAVDGTLTGAIAAADPIRESTPAALAALGERSIETALLSGDAKAVAAAVGERLGVGKAIGGVKPDGKVREVRKLARDNRRVAMVGDGINDAPALAAADVGIAMGGGADVAAESAGIVLLRPDPRLVPAALDLARATKATIRRNLFWAFAFNVVGLPLAALGMLSPVIAGAAMAASSIAVVSSALLLTRWQPKAIRHA